MTLRLEDLKKNFGGLAAVRGASFEVQPGEILGLVGPNGAGKTTIFNMISGLLKPTSGRVVFNGQDVSGKRPYQIARLGIGRTFQHTRIFHDMKVIENVILARAEINDAIGRSMLVASGDWARWRSEALEHLETVGIAHHADDYGGDLSYAEQKLVMFACLIAGGAEVLLLDEPTAGLDPSSQKLIIEAVKRLGSPNRMLVLIEHNLDVVRGCCQRVVFLAQGEVLANGTPAEVESKQELRELYFGAGTVGA